MSHVLETIIEHYQAPDEALELVRSTKIALLVGISGAGKDTIKHELLKQEVYRDIVSHTTRAPRMNNGVLEQDGREYHFIDEAKAQTMLERGEFIEAKYVHGTVYGTSLAELVAAHEEGKVAITDIDVQGVEEYKDLSNRVVAIFVLPPSYEAWIQRLKKRYDSEEAFRAEWPKRRASAISEIEQSLTRPHYHFVINDELSRAVSVTDEIAQGDDTFHRKDDEARALARALLAEIQMQS